MKITKWVDCSTEVEVHIDGADVIAALHDDTEGRTFDELLKRYINTLGGALKNIPAETIEALTPSVRNLIYGFLTEQAGRFAPPTEDMEGGAK